MVENESDIAAFSDFSMPQNEEEASSVAPVKAEQPTEVKQKQV